MHQAYDGYSKVMKRLVNPVKDEDQIVFAQVLTLAAITLFYSSIIYYMVHISSKVYSEVKCVI